ncbi:hypothetical protein TeGR_g13216, partial [Tetraparma gracilis]
LKKFLTVGDGAKMKKIEAAMSKIGCKDGSETWVSNKNIDAFLQSVDGSTAKRDVGDYEVQQHAPAGGAIEAKLEELSRQMMEIKGLVSGKAAPAGSRAHSEGINRYCRLFGSGTIAYYEKPGGPQKGTIALAGAVASKLPADGEFDVGNRDGTIRTFHLRAPTNSAREMWLIYLESAGCELK